MGNQTAKMQHSHNEEYTKDQCTASATEPNTAMSGPTSNNDGKEMTLAEDQSPTAPTEPNTATSEPTSNNSGKWLTLPELRFLIGDLQGTTNFWIQVQTGTTYPYVYLNSSAFSMDFDARIDLMNALSNTTALFNLTDVTPQPAPSNVIVVQVQCVCSNDTWLTATSASAPLQFLPEGSTGSISFTCTEDPKVPKHYTVTTTLNKVIYFLMATTNSSGAKIVTLTDSRSSVSVFEISDSN